MTFSLVARCAETGRFGIAISSSSPAVAARCAHVRAGVGAVASQNVTDPALGPLLLDLMGEGIGAEEAMAALTRGRRFVDYRQLLAVDAAGQGAVHSGDRALGLWGAAIGPNVAAGGNLLASDQIPALLVEAFGAAKGDLGDRLIAAMQAGLAAGGEAGPVRSAGLKIADRLSWPSVDLRVDWTEGDPIAELAVLWAIYRPQVADYIQRANDPTAAPSYGVPGMRLTGSPQNGL